MTFFSYTGDGIMLVRNRLQGLGWAVLVEVVYLAGRYLRHGLAWDVFQRQLRSDVKTQHREQSVGIVRQLVADIEAVEGTDIKSLPRDRRLVYLSGLNDILMQRIDSSADKAEVEAALIDLRAQP